MDLDIGRTGAVLLAVLFVLLTVEDIVVWLTAGTVPGVEFFVGGLIVLAVFLYTIRAARRTPPPRR